MTNFLIKVINNLNVEIEKLTYFVRNMSKVIINIIKYKGKIEIENKVREKLGIALRVGGAPAASVTAASTGKASKASKSAAAAAPVVGLEDDADEL